MGGSAKSRRRVVSRDHEENGLPYCVTKLNPKKPTMTIHISTTAAREKQIPRVEHAGGKATNCNAIPRLTERCFVGNPESPVDDPAYSPEITTSASIATKVSQGPS